MIDSEIEEVAVDKIKTPTPSEKLHPYQDEDQEDWNEFKQSVGTQPEELPTVRENGSGYELIDGDRRMRAVEENDGDTVMVRVRHDVETEEDLLESRVLANEFRKENDKQVRARYIAQLCAPHLLLPGERNPDIDKIHSQTKVGGWFGKAQAQMSQWLVPLRDEEYPVRGILGKGRSIDQDLVDQIDRIMEELDEFGINGQEEFLADELSEIDYKSLGEVENAIKKGNDEGWTMFRLLEYMRENFGDEAEEKPEGVETGIMGDQKDFSSSTPENTPDFEDTTDEDTTEEDTEEDSSAIPDLREEIDTEDDDQVLDLVDDESIRRSASARRMRSERLEDTAAVSLEVLCQVFGVDEREVMRKIVQPAIVRETKNILREQ